MRLLPFVVSKPYEVSILTHTLKIYRIAFLLEQGTNIWMEDTGNTKDIRTNFLEPNDIFAHNDKFWSMADDIHLIPIDSQKTKLSEFMFYDDGTSEGLVWRSFYYIYNTEQDKSFLDDWKYPENISRHFDEALKVWRVINI
jgi:hypothetical protein